MPGIYVASPILYETHDGSFLVGVEFAEAAMAVDFVAQHDDLVIECDGRTVFISEFSEAALAEQLFNRLQKLGKEWTQ